MFKKLQHPTRQAEIDEAAEQCSACVLLKVKYTMCLCVCAFFYSAIGVLEGRVIKLMRDRRGQSVSVGDM